MKQQSGDHGEHEDTRLRLMAAAMRCVQRLGIEKTSLNAIAQEAGCARQTVYNHFANADAVILAALLEASQSFAERMIAHVQAWPSAGDRVVEAMMFCLEHLPQEPLLQMIGDPRFAPLANISLFTAETSRQVIRRVAGVCLAPAPALAPQVDELGEMMTRLLLSLLLLDGPAPRSPDEMRAFLRRWLLPGLGL